MSSPSPRDMRVRFWGVRGSTPAASAAMLRGGGHTPCVEVRCGETVLIFDAGTGLHPAGLALEAEGVRTCHLFFSHSHYDHIIGLPAFRLLFEPEAALSLWSGQLHASMTAEAMVRRFLEPPFLPAVIAASLTRVAFHDFRAGDVLRPAPGISVATTLLNHPGGSIAYRVRAGGKSVTYMTDHEHTPGAWDETLIRFAAGSDLLIHDAMFSDEEFSRRRGYGHSTWQQAVGFAQSAGAKRLALFHHSPRLTDGGLDAIEAAARGRFAEAFAARDGLEMAP
jgi:phosphoribosyl 1,2-cyclic phosphodiesterase